MDGSNTFKGATRNIGANKGKPRLWIEGALLIEAGLDHGARWNLLPHTDGDGFNISRDDSEGRRKIAGKPGRPIIDITGKTLADAGFATGDVARLTYVAGSGIIVVRREADHG